MVLACPSTSHQADGISREEAAGGSKMRDLVLTTTREGDHWVTEISFKMRSLNPPMIDGLKLEEALVEAARASMPEERRSER